jgi:chromosome segregation ATPase
VKERGKARDEATQATLALAAREAQLAAASRSMAKKDKALAALEDRITALQLGLRELETSSAALTAENQRLRDDLHNLQAYDIAVEAARTAARTRFLQGNISDQPGGSSSAKRQRLNDVGSVGKHLVI